MNCYSDFNPTLSDPICKQCGFCFYCRDLTCLHREYTGQWLALLEENSDISPNNTPAASTGSGLFRISAEFKINNHTNHK